MSRNVLITAGGTGGHVFPALAVAKELIKRGCSVNWVGGLKGIENEIVPKNNIHLERIAISGLRKKGIFKALKLPFMLARAIYQAYKIVRLHKPSVVISFGGYASFPVALVAKCLRVPLIIHEQNSIAGLTNKVLSKLANYILVAYKGVLQNDNGKTLLVGNPVREDIVQIENVETRYNKRTGLLKVLILGGSLGAKVFNDNLPYVFEHLTNIDSIVHQVGRGEAQIVAQTYKELKVSAEVVTFIDNMAGVLSNVDLVICRAGALTVSEISVAGIAAVFVPYPYAVDNHQKFNAEPLVEKGAAFMLLQKDFSIQKMVLLIKDLNRETCLKMAIQAKKYAVSDSQIRIADIAQKFISV